MADCGTFCSITKNQWSQALIHNCRISSNELSKAPPKPDTKVNTNVFTQEYDRNR